MSDELLSHREGAVRSLNAEEKRLVHALFKKSAKLDLPDGWLDRVQVVGMKDGAMGSLQFLSSPPSQASKIEQVAEIIFVDEDGVDVIASLNLDEKGLPFELDIWKTNFEPLIRIPDKFS